MRPITWLHISDLHLRPGEAWGQDVVLNTMCTDIAGRCTTSTPDFVLMTGDLAFSGKPEEYELAARFFDDLSAASRVPKERIYCVPGNHDINRERQQMAFIGTRMTLQDQNHIDTFLEPSSREDLATLLQREEGYRTFQESYFRDQDRTATDDGLAYVARVVIEDVCLAIIGLDSAWLATGGIEDHGKLLLGERQVINALRLAQEGGEPPHILVAMSHHPIHVLQEFDRRPAQTHIERDCHYLHCGHLHDPEQRPAGGHGANGCLTLASGASFETRHSRNSYAIVTLDLLRGVRSVTTIHYNHHDATWAATDEAAFPIEIQPSGVCSVGELATAIAALHPALVSWSHYFAALLLDQKAEVPVPTTTGYAFGSFAVLEAGPDCELKDRAAAFMAFRNAIRVLYQRVPLARIFQLHGTAIAHYGTALTALSETHATLRTRLDELESDSRGLAAVEPRQSFSHTITMMNDIAGAGDWDLLRRQAQRHIDSRSPPVALAARRMLALALTNGTERADKEVAVSLYQQLSESDVLDPTDFGNLAMLLVEIGRPEDAQNCILRGISACPKPATAYLAEIGQRVVGATGDREFRTQMEVAIVEKSKP